MLTADEAPFDPFSYLGSSAAFQVIVDIYRKCPAHLHRRDRGIRRADRPRRSPYRTNAPEPADQSCRPCLVSPARLHVTGSVAELVKAGDRFSSMVRADHQRPVSGYVIRTFINPRFALPLM